MTDPMTITAGPVLLPPLVAYLALMATPAVRRRANLSRRRPVAVTILVGYAAAVLAITIFPITLHPADHGSELPWWTVLRWIPFKVDPVSMVANVIMLIPFGVLLPLLWPSTGTLRRIAVLGCATSAAIELTQLVLGLTLNSRRTVDVNDLIANTAGAVVGLFLLRLARSATTDDRQAESDIRG